MLFKVLVNWSFCAIPALPVIKSDKNKFFSRWCCESENANELKVNVAVLIIYTKWWMCPVISNRFPGFKWKTKRKKNLQSRWKIASKWASIESSENDFFFMFYSCDWFNDCFLIKFVIFSSPFVSSQLPPEKKIISLFIGGKSSRRRRSKTFAYTCNFSYECARSLITITNLMRSN